MNEASASFFLQQGLVVLSHPNFRVDKKRFFEGMGRGDHGVAFRFFVFMQSGAGQAGVSAGHDVGDRVAGDAHVVCASFLCGHVGVAMEEISA